MNGTVVHRDLKATILVLVLMCACFFCAGTLTGCSDDNGVTDPGPKVDDPVPPDLPPGGKVPEVNLDTTGDVDF